MIADLLPAPRMSRVAGMHYCAPAPSEPCKQLFTAHGSSKPQRLAGRQKRWTRLYGGSIPPLTVSMEETEPLIARNALSWKRDVLLCYRLPGDNPPRFPFLRALRRVVGVQQESSAGRATTVLHL